MLVGDTVSLRIATPDATTEVVGVVLAASADALTVRRRDGRVIEVTRASITAGRVVPPSPAQRIGADELERVAALGWRALETQPLGEWLLRASAGVTSRANGALAIGSPGLPHEEAVDRVEAWYAARSLPPRIQLPVAATGPAGLGPVLDARGWASSPEVHQMTAELGPVLRAAGDAAVAVRLDETVDDAWLAAWRPDEGTDRETARRLVTNHPAVVFASLRDGDRCLAVARATVDERWAGLFCVEVTPDRRRTGLGTAVSVAALRWAVSHGARRGYLQVEAHNAAGVAAYERLGFTTHHSYVHRTRRTVDG